MEELSLYATKPSPKGGLQIASDNSLKSLLGQMGFSWNCEPRDLNAGQERDYRFSSYNHETHIVIHSKLSESPQTHLVLATITGEFRFYAEGALSRLKDFYASKGYRTEVLE